MTDTYDCTCLITKQITSQVNVRIFGSKDIICTIKIII